MKKIVVTTFLVLAHLCLISQELDTNQNNSVSIKKNTLRVEFVGKSILLGFTYDRMVFHRKIDGYASLGVGIGYTPYTISFPMFNVAFYLKTNHWEINPLLGVGSANIAVYRVHETPVHSYLFAMAGVDIRLDASWSFQLLYTPMYGFMYYNHTSYGYLNGGYLHYGGFNFGYKF